MLMFLRWIFDSIPRGTPNHGPDATLENQLTQKKALQLDQELEEHTRVFQRSDTSHSGFRSVTCLQRYDSISMHEGKCTF